MDSETKEIIIRMETKQALFHEQVKERLAGVDMAQNAIVEELVEIKHTITSGIKFLALSPVTLGGTAIVSFLFYFEKLSEWSWVTLIVLFLSPFYGDGIKLLLSRFNGKNEK